MRKGEKASHLVFVSFREKTNEKPGKFERVFFLKSYTVFNVAQCDGLVLKGDKPETINPDCRETLAEAFLAETGAAIRHGESRAYWRPSTDVIMLPNFENFSSRDAYYETAFHELTHWTGVAELGSAFIMAEFGFDSAHRDTAYIAHWIKFLTATCASRCAVRSQKRFTTVRMKSMKRGELFPTCSLAR